MGLDRTIVIGGEAGQGIQTVGQLLAAACHGAGFEVLAVNDFESRIRGGHSSIGLRVADRPVSAPCRRIDLLVALDAPSEAVHRSDLAEDGLVLADRAAGLAEGRALSLPLEQMAREAGGKILANTVAAGACLGLLGAPEDHCRRIVRQQFEAKGDEVVDRNIVAFTAGYAATRNAAFNGRIQAGWDRPPRGRLMEGNLSVALGAVAADCRVGAFYPMSPATGIMAQLASLSGRYPLVVEQAEDEIAAANMVVGASFAGVRAMTATSGGGFSLMTEALGLAAITETPMVVVDAMRPGPATGLPTRTAQGDLNFVIHASQDEFPRFVFAPGSPEQAFETMARAFELSERFQVPAIVLVDQFFNDSLFTVTDFPPQPKVVRHIIGDADMADPAAYRRFAVTADGVSPRALPCRGKALVVAASDDHREDGHLSETMADRRKMVAKRFAKLPAMTARMRPPETLHPEADLLLATWGSSRGAVWEAVETLREAGRSVGAVHFCDLWPFPAEAAGELFATRPWVTVEQNYSGQLGRLVREQTGLKPAGRITRTDGRPFFAEEIVAGLKETKGLKGPK
jgi:2-oxoglutarate ferredoxin oxidoreductase subunit alpha